MKTLSGRILEKCGWRITGDYGDLKKSVTIFAPHTAHIDAIYGKLGFTELGVKFKFLSKKELFFFPMNLVMRKFGSIPVRGVKGKNAIYQVVDLLESSEELHIVVSPEGWIKKMEKWNKGFFYMAQKAQVPIVVAALDYGKKEMGVLGIIYDTSDFTAVMGQIKEFYKEVKGKKPEQFALHVD
ncbi:1-acyl-sn-glycerol-3-phosphate acyltransferase [Maribellus maritimus]|uniref:1-acyl-sn-glycerol-3-phosphate acyltransferase n=1 Tax=Maribellus maritimus TaxID=2870838 RepID=UPI001EEC9601|nr:1-acyl-sn-glycerol-3-phosphate acyltransferase [Maribellus maritimus]MCG6186107.1 1-acyl-sn-glycerol-3-phosphate acyltransferase [Maribellus maritimus]